MGVVCWLFSQRQPAQTIARMRIWACFTAARRITYSAIAREQRGTFLRPVFSFVGLYGLLVMFFGLFPPGHLLE